MKKIILIGMKASGKTTVGRLLAKKLFLKHIELDDEIEKSHAMRKKEKLIFREIFKKYGEAYFRMLETQILDTFLVSNKDADFVLSVGGGTVLNEENQGKLKKGGKIIFLNPDSGILLQRILKDGIPAFFSSPGNPKKSLDELLLKRKSIYEKVADYVISFEKESPEEIIKKIMDVI